MAAFEIRVNGERRFLDRDVTAVTLAADWIARRGVDRVSVHVGTGGAGEREVQYLGADLVPGDEITIRVLSETGRIEPTGEFPEFCSYCNADYLHVRSLVRGVQVAICDECILGLSRVVTDGAALPIGASIRTSSEIRCGFCLKVPPDVPGLLVRNDAGICAECLRSVSDMTR